LSKKLNQHVMTAKFRLGLTEVYRNALRAAGVTASEIKPHMDSSATVTVTEPQLVKLREITGLKELSGHSNAGRITIHIPAAAVFLKNNRPTLTPEERAAKGRKGTGAGADKEEAERRRREREALRAQLNELHGIDLGAEEEEEEEADEE
jgi:hypothetical protein